MPLLTAPWSRHHLPQDRTYVAIHPANKAAELYSIAGRCITDEKPSTAATAKNTALHRHQPGSLQIPPATIADAA